MAKILTVGVKILLVILIFAGYSCKKDESIKVIITVKYLNSQTPVPSALVRLSKKDIRVEKITNSNGIAEFEFENEAILDVEAISGNYYGTTVVKLVSGETINKTVYVN